VVDEGAELADSKARLRFGCSAGRSDRKQERQQTEARKEENQSRAGPADTTPGLDRDKRYPSLFSRPARIGR
jgi:hypothetical protein